jgi:hypothetical protein
MGCSWSSFSPFANLIWVSPLHPCPGKAGSLSQPLQGGFEIRVGYRGVWRNAAPFAISPIITPLSKGACRKLVAFTAR